jgi:hypothetical protein
MSIDFALPGLQTAYQDRSEDMTPLLKEVLDAHGGLTQWNKFTKISATIRSGGDLWEMKGVPQDPSPRQMSASLDKEWSSVFPYGAPDKLTDFTANRVAILTVDGSLVAERFDPAEHAEGKDTSAPWDALDRAYFNGYALWTYLNVPFLLAWTGFDVVEIPSWQEDDEEWRGLRATFPPDIASHSKEQDFYFGAGGLLRRHDYHVNASGGFAATQYVSHFVEVEGIKLPTTRRAYMRAGNLTPLTDRLMVSIDLSDFRLW